MRDKEILDLEKRLGELLGQYKEEPQRSAISMSMQPLRALDQSKMSLKEFLRCKSALPTTLIQLIDTTGLGGNGLPSEGGGDRHKAAVQLRLLDLIHHCLLNDGFTGMQVSEIIIKISNIPWTGPCVMKILQMSFYFIRYDLDASMLFRLLSLIVESFVAEDGSLDLVARPVVIQTTEQLLKSVTSDSEDPALGSRVCILDFIYDTIVAKRNYFASYILLIVIKHPCADKLPGFTQFIANEFFKISLEVLRSPRLDDTAPIYESILKVERSFRHFALRELDAFYTELDGVESELLLRFLACLLNLREEVPESIAALLCRMIGSVDLYDKRSKKTIKLLEEIVASAGHRVELSRRLMDAILPKFSTDLVPDAKDKEGCPYSLMKACLKHSSENDLRDIFESGLRKCGASAMTEVCVELKEYMGMSWHIYFDACKEHSFAFLQEFTRDQTALFVAELPNGNLLGMKVFESGYRVLGDGENTDVLRRLLEKITDHQVLLAILLKFCSLNAQKRISPVILSLLKDFFEHDLEHVADLFTFLGKAIRIIDPRSCWDQIFGILMIGDSFYHEKMQIILCIEQNHLSDLEERHTRATLQLLEQIMLLSSADSEAVLNAIFIYKEFGRLALTRGYDAWRDFMRFGVRMVEEQEYSMSEILLKHLFDFFRIGISYMVEEDVSFVNTVVMSRLYTIREELKLASVLREVLQFISDHSLGVYTIDLVSFLSTVICDPLFASDCTIPTLALECLKAICRKYKADFEEGSTQKQGSRDIDCRADIAEPTCPPDAISKHEHIHFNESSSDPAGSEAENVHLSEVSAILINSRVFPTVCTSSIPEKDARHAVVSTLVAGLIYILRNCSLEQYPTISGVLQMIPSFYFSSSEISALSEYLRKFVELSDPYRTEAIDCFVKTCGSSNGGTHCLKILSSWLSKESKETSLTLMDKISDRITRNLEDDVIGGLVNFIEYSMQFSGSDEFLEPVLNVISKSRPRIRDAEVFDKLYAFSHRFIIEQLSIPHTAKRESAILRYLDFFSSLLREFQDEKYLKLLVSIIHSNRHYLSLRLRSYEILFENYEFSEELLKDELRTRIRDYSGRFLREGLGISNFLTIEMIFCLRQICILKSSGLIGSLKEELIDLLVVRDFEIIGLVRKLLRIHLLGR